METIDIVTEFKEKASLVSAVIHEAEKIEDAFDIAVSLCNEVENRLCNITEARLRNATETRLCNVMESKKMGIIAAPELDNSMFELLEKRCLAKGISLIQNQLRGHASGIEIGLTFADFGIAETGTVVVCSDSEDKRLATMISDIHAVLLYKSDIRASALDMADELAALTQRTSSYTAFITGPSRTADIERVLAIGVHGPLELHIILLEGTLHNISAKGQKMEVQ
ncbi:MAG: lactate utilization protein [Desulfamplus sp.]|nr:lactate utilization protein [Desulfamplus sp.]